MFSDSLRVQCTRDSRHVVREISIGDTLRLAFSVLFVSLMLVGNADRYQTAQKTVLTQGMVKDRMPSFQLTCRMAAAMERFRQTQVAALIANIAERQALGSRWQSESLGDIQALLDDQEPLTDPGEEAQTLIPAIEAASKKYQVQSLSFAGDLGDRRGVFRPVGFALPIATCKL